MFRVLDATGRVKTALIGPLTVMTDTSTGTVTGWTPTIIGDTLIEWSGSSDATFDSLVAGVLGQRVTIKNTGSHVAYFAHLSGSATKAKFSNSATSGPTPVAAGGSGTWTYDGTDWQLTNHNQGAPISYTATVTASGSMTVTSPLNTICQYALSGAQLTIFFYGVGGTLGGVASTAMYISLPSTYTGTTIMSAQLNAYLYNNGAGNAQGFCQNSSGDTKIGFFNNAVAAWTLATLNVYGSLQFTVQ